MADLDELRITFFQECDDLLERLGEGLRMLATDDAAGQGDTINAVFRAVHSIKGGAGAFGLDDLVGFSHLFETVLDNLRAGRMDVTPPVAETLLRAGDMLDDLVQAAQTGAPPPAERLGRIVAELELHADGGDDDPLGDFVFEPVVLDFADAPDAPEAPDGLPRVSYDIRLAPHAEMYMSGNEPAALITALGELGSTGVSVDSTAMVPLAEFEPDQPRLAWRITLESDASEDEVAAVFDFVEGLAELEITRRPPVPPKPDSSGPMRDAVSVPPATDGRPARDTPVLAPPAAELRGPGGDKVVAMTAPVTVRVNLDRIDRLANLIGELVIMEAVLSRIIREAGLATNADAASGLDRIRQLAGDIQESVMAIRAQPLRPIFQRMERVLREASEATGKAARLVTHGADTEVDKTVIERLVDPLTHMIRNAVDHGLEDGEARVAAGKGEEGTITLSAAHRSGRVVIEIADDGAGINRERVRRIAEEKSLVSADAVMAPAEVDAILFMPGFSSKADVSAVSGRGVGLDVVQREIQALGGRVTIASQPGQGSTFTISLPLTLAVLEGMLVECGDQTMVLPLAAVSETLNPAGATIHEMGETGRMLAHEGRLIPVIDAAARFRSAAADGNRPPGVLVVIEGGDGATVALAVGRILDQRQVVIKSLEEHCGPVPGIAAATILGDGRVALILDTEVLLRGAPGETGAALDMAGGWA